jgi:8-hydroxy-5-deazaflavin:NADPH oxidoreductase
MESRKKIGILGSGVVAQTLGKGFLKYGYEVMLGTREVSKLADWVKENGGRAGSFSEAAAFGDLLVLAVKGAMAASALNLAGPNHLKGKTIIDATNPIMDAPPVHGVIQFYTSLSESQMEKLQEAYPEANFVKAFSCAGNAHMVDPDYAGIKPTMFYCGNSETSKSEVKTILERFGWEAEDMGSMEAARAIEPLCILWCIPGLTRNQWSHSFKLLKK